MDCLICGVIELLAFIVSFILFWPTRSVFRVHRVASRSFTVSFCWTAETEPEHLSCWKELEDESSVCQYEPTQTVTCSVVHVDHRVRTVTDWFRVTSTRFCLSLMKQSWWIIVIVTMLSVHCFRVRFWSVYRITGMLWHTDLNYSAVLHTNTRWSQSEILQSS